MPGRPRLISSDQDWRWLARDIPWLPSVNFLMLPIIAGQPYLYQTEWDLHRDITKALAAARVPFRHEVTLGPGAKIDFVSRGIGVEIKVAGQPAEVSKQLRRYHATWKLDALVLLTTRADHVAEIPEHGLGGLTLVLHLWAFRSLLPRRARQLAALEGRV